MALTMEKHGRWMVLLLIGRSKDAKQELTDDLQLKRNAINEVTRDVMGTFELRVFALCHLDLNTQNRKDQEWRRTNECAVGDGK